ncbi:MAG TPA: hypothetical protein VJL54_01940 [Nitrososphaera sp.]|nr:hypothetical protein [Nitrososphaera sp.]
MPRAIVLAGALAAGLALYFALSLYVLPQAFQEVEKPPRPLPVVTAVNISSQQIALGDTLRIQLEGANAGDTADMQIISAGFPNLTGTGDIEILRHDFRQTPFMIRPGDDVSANYEGVVSAVAQYPSVEGYSMPWEGGSAYSMELQVKPQSEGRFVIFVKSVALPHTWDGAHYPRGGLLDYQREYVEFYSVQVTKS